MQKMEGAWYVIVTDSQAVTAGGHHVLECPHHQLPVLNQEHSKTLQPVRFRHTARFGDDVGVLEVGVGLDVGVSVVALGHAWWPLAVSSTEIGSVAGGGDD